MAIIQKSILSNFKIITLSVLLLISFTYSGTVYARETESKVKTIVIDAGHGGKDPGACGAVYYEKDVVLPVALRLGRLIEEGLPDVKVMYTRKKDVFVELNERANIANKANADLFISIHANAGKVGDRESNGYETLIMGRKTKENTEIVMRENSVIKYEDNYEKEYEEFYSDSPDADIIFSLMQSSFQEKSIKFAEFIQAEFAGGPIELDRGLKQGAFIVLYRTASPSAIIEIGFISNIAEEQKLADADNQQKIAESIYKAVLRYRNHIDGIIDDSSDSVNINIQNNTIVHNNDTPTTDHDNQLSNSIITDTDNTKNQPKKTSTQNSQPKNYKWITE